ncbi:aminoglycoside phosphotransferase family protein [Reichenbachiella carrageenanivorans]|uniref:Aminoglycoside phosphotransferase family protein n=1 Tax=Reichenbachiella carrageenanivorans TaxID=2979869 RepID=A0ABY6D592_9BACT|nr:aminoglycoside phosphotransferase family protein [Reichenbachiella carrageenanivorans]UXX81306.1 aminoglycoside phosphotransferase family protein [Reichenbachiella carrageenanivorans]
MKEIISQFFGDKKFSKAIPFGSGHINDTYRIVGVEGVQEDFLLQRINHHVFQDVPLLMGNMVAVTDHLNRKIVTSAELSSTTQTIDIIPAINGQSFIEDGSGDFWRVMVFLKGYESYDLVETPEQAYYGARAFGQFMMMLDDFDASTLGDVIPDFHNIISRLTAFQSAVSQDVAGRVARCQDEIKYVLSLADQMCGIEKLKQSGAIRQRVTHNDTKFNNVLLSADHQRSCVIDLDTVMPGVVHYDFGDGVRTSTGTAAEDELNLDKIQFDMEKFEAFAHGYLEMTREVLQPIELAHLALSGPLLAYIMGVRFLTDYLSGDHYYKIAYEQHNYDRARNQLTFTKRMMERLPDMAAILA